MGVEYTLSVNKFNRPKKFIDVEGNPSAAQILAVRLILLEPGTIQSHPSMGVGIISRYRYSNVEELDTLRYDIQEQIRKWIPDMYDCQVSVTEDNRIVYITMVSNGYPYTIGFDKTTLQLADL